MYRMFCCVVLAVVSLSAQTSADAARLSPALSKVLTSAGRADDAAGQSLASTMMSLTTGDHRPARQVDALVNALRGVMAGREVSEAQAAVLSQCFVNVLRGQGSNLTLATQVRQELTALRVGDQRTDLIVKRFIALGEAVRGPDDIPVLVDSLK